MNNNTDYQVIYHQIKSLKGTTVKKSEAIKMLRKGWVDTPAKFKKGVRGKWYTVKIKLIHFWFAHWQWITGTMLSIIGLYLLWIQVRFPK